ncbi:MAG: hypothetical protein KZQ76_05805 [Candidatus Thiodiazotropha sp. (ex Epidulcina cf. delphinae)]|nr:hypothetical protein [Candidatus Thiodiazotropha sp. (ex Epidulcina cf. delphinae)]
MDWGLGLNSRWAIDISSKASWDPDTHHSAMAHAFGLDFHKVFSSESGDIGTLVFQPYLVSLNNVPNPPFFFDDGNDTELTWRIANFNYTALSEGEFNIRAGHFEIPFGLEQNIDTNGALRQYTFSDRGIKADWGISVNGVLPALDYEIALTRGSGNEIENQENPYIISGRIGSPSYKNLVSGFSWLYGDVLGAVGVTRLKRAAVDVAYYYHNWEFLMELSGGKNEHTDTLNSLIEVSWRNALEDLHLYIQWRHLQLKPESRWEAGDDIAAGVRWLPMPYLEISTQYEKQVDLIKQQQNPTRLTLQFRLRI